MPTKQVILCADDYSLTPAISEGILQLAERKRLTAVSCMTLSPYWERHASSLHPYRDHLDIGLHFTLTDLPPMHAPAHTHFQLMRKAYTRRLRADTLRKELDSQLEQFHKHMGCAPDFIDGHQHIHQLPIVRDVLLQAYAHRFPNKTCYIRVPSPALLGIKPALIRLTGAHALRRRLLKRNIPFNTSFSGVYTFSHAAQYRSYCQKFLRHIQSGGLIMCHPGLRINSSADSIALLRWHEYQYFNSDAFLQDCEVYQVKLARFSSTVYT